MIVPGPNAPAAIDFYGQSIDEQCTPSFWCPKEPERRVTIPVECARDVIGNVIDWLDMNVEFWTVTSRAYSNDDPDFGHPDAFIQPYYDVRFWANDSFVDQFMIALKMLDVSFPDEDDEEQILNWDRREIEEYENALINTTLRETLVDLEQAEPPSFTNPDYLTAIVRIRNHLLAVQK